MERITFLIESTHLRLTCLLNPEDREDSLTLERSSGIAREEGGSLLDNQLTDSPVEARGRGDTRLTLKLLFDVALSPVPVATNDVRELTRPLWELTEYTTASRSLQAGARAEPTALRQGSRGIPQVRLFWGKGWEIPAVVESVAERYERFSEDGRPQRSWLTLRLLRVSDEIAPAELPEHLAAETLPALEELLPAPAPASVQAEQTWGVHVKLGGGTLGDQLWQLAARYLGDPRLWRWIALQNQIDDPQQIQAGTPLVIPPLKTLAARPRSRRAK